MDCQVGTTSSFSRKARLATNRLSVGARLRRPDTIITSPALHDDDSADRAEKERSSVLGSSSAFCKAANIQCSMASVHNIDEFKLRLAP